MDMRRIAKQCGMVSVMMVAFTCQSLAADFETPRCQQEVLVPCAKEGWQLGFEALYVQTTSDDLAYAQNTNRTEYLRNKWTFAFQINVGYHFGQGNDLLLSWRRIDKISKRASQDLQIPSSFGLIPVIPSVVLPPALELFPQGIVAEADVNEQNLVALDFGKTAFWGPNLTTRHFAGIQYARVESDLKVNAKALRLPNALQPVTSPFVATTVETLSRFNGLGARVGMEGAYHLGGGVSLVGLGYVGALFGEVDYRQNVTAIVNSITLERAVVNSIRTRTNTVSPNAEGRIGLRYTRDWSEDNQVELEAGYLATNFWSTVRGSQAYAPPVTLINGLGAFGYHGPYVKLSWIGT